MMQDLLEFMATDVTADSKEVAGQCACFVHHCSLVLAPDSSLLSALDGGDSLEQTVGRYEQTTDTLPKINQLLQFERFLWFRPQLFT